MKRVRMFVLLGLFLISVNALAADHAVQDTAPTRDNQVTDAQTLQRWQRLSPTQQQTLRERYQQYQQMPAEQQQQLRQNLQRFKAMAPPQQQRIQRRFKQWRTLPLERREQLRQTYQDFSQLTPEQQQQLRHDLEQLQELPDVERAERTEQLRHEYMGRERRMSPAGGMPRQPMRRMGH